MKKMRIALAMVLGKSKQQFRNDAAIWRMIANLRRAW